MATAQGSSRSPPSGILSIRLLCAGFAFRGKTRSGSFSSLFGGLFLLVDGGSDTGNHDASLGQLSIRTEQASARHFQPLSLGDKGKVGEVEIPPVSVFEDNHAVGWDGAVCLFPNQPVLCYEVVVAVWSAGPHFDFYLHIAVFTDSLIADRLGGRRQVAFPKLGSLTPWGAHALFPFVGRNVPFLEPSIKAAVQLVVPVKPLNLRCCIRCSKLLIEPLRHFLMADAYVVFQNVVNNSSGETLVVWPTGKPHGVPLFRWWFVL